MMRNSRRASSSVSDEVGSSKAISRPPARTARMISIIWRCAGPEAWRRAAAAASRSSMPNAASTARRLLFEPSPVEQDAEPARHVADEDVLGHRQVGDDLRLLVDDADAGGMRLASARESACGRAVDRDLAAVGREHALEQAHQRRLAGAVLADQRQNLAGAEVERYVVERLHDAEGLGQPLDSSRFRSRPAWVSSREVALTDPLWRPAAARIRSAGADSKIGLTCKSSAPCSFACIGSSRR